MLLKLFFYNCFCFIKLGFRSINKCICKRPYIKAYMWVWPLVIMTCFNLFRPFLWWSQSAGIFSSLNLDKVSFIPSFLPSFLPSFFLDTYCHSFFLWPVTFSSRLVSKKLIIFSLFMHQKLNYLLDSKIIFPKTALHCQQLRSNMVPKIQCILPSVSEVLSLMTFRTC